jgi:TolB-like protein
MKFVFLLLFLAFAAYGEERVAIINTVDNGDSIGISDLAYLTAKLRETAVDVLPKPRYGVMTTETIVAYFESQELAAKVCKESACLAELGRKVNADYVAQARIGRLGKNLAINVDLYSSKSGNLIASFIGNSKDIFGLLNIIDEKAPALFKKMPGVSGGSRAVPNSVEGGIVVEERTLMDAAQDYGRSYVVSLSTEPQGAILVFNGEPVASCGKTPCKAELPEGDIRIVAALEQYERMDTTVSIRQNNQSINMKLKPNFGVLEIKPAYSDGIGAGKGWSLAINGKGQSSYENRLSPGNYDVKLSHECYEDISFKAGINKGSREVFEMARHLSLKTGGLVLSAEKDGEPASEPVFVNGKLAGETPFSGTVPVCAEIGIGSGKSKVDVKVAHKQTVRHKHKVSAPQIVAAPRAVVACGRQERVAIINTVDDRDSIGISELVFDRLRETAINVLPKSCYGIMTKESIVAFLGSYTRAAKECAASCLVELGRKVSADYVAQARIGRSGGNLTIMAEIYSIRSNNLIGFFIGSSKDISGLLTIIDEKAPAMFKTMPGASSNKRY